MRMVQETFVLDDQVKLYRQGMSGGYHRGHARPRSFFIPAEVLAWVLS